MMNIQKNKFNTLVSNDRLEKIILYANERKNLLGDISEVGVYKGGTAKLISKIFSDTNKKIYLFDTFEGMPPSDPKKDFHNEGDFNDTNIKLVKEYLKDCNNISIFKGFFPDSATEILLSKFCFVHIDVDIYKSVFDCCKFFYSRMVKNGIIIFDDYGFKTCPGAKLAVDEFFKNKIENPIELETKQCIIIKK